LVLGEGAGYLAPQVRVQRAERRTEIIARPDMRLVVVEAVVVDGDEHPPRLEPRRHHFGNEGVPGWETRQVLRDVLPALPSVARDAPVAIVLPGIVDARLLRLLSERDDRRPLGYAVVARDRDIAALQPHRDDGVAVRTAGQVRADRRPRIAAIGGLEHFVRRGQERTWIVWRQHERSIPVEAVRFTLRRRGAHVRGGRTNRLRLARNLVASDHVPILRLGVDDARIAKVGKRDETVTTFDLEPVVVHDAAGLA